MKTYGLPRGLFKTIGAGLVSLGLAACTQLDSAGSGFDRTEALELVEVLSSDNLQGRAAGTEGNLEAQGIIKARFSELGLAPLTDTYEHPFTYGDFKKDEDGSGKPDKTGTNLIAKIEGTTGSDDTLIITAHFDHVGVIEGEIYNGADDNASGVAALLAVAEHFQQAKPKHDILLVALDAEEDGLGGAFAFVRNPPLPKEQMAFNLNLDMIARGDNGQLWASGTSHWPGLIPLIETVAADAPVTLKMGYDSGDGRDDWTLLSDHAAFFRAGVPHLYLGVEDHVDYHKPTDDFENIDQDWFVRSIETVVLVAEAVDQMDLSSLKPAGNEIP